MKKFAKWFLITMISLSCGTPVDSNNVDRKIEPSVHADTSASSSFVHPQQIPTESSFPQVITGVTSHELVDFAKTLIGIPYKYASTDPSEGFDCSGFITHVFNHFNVAVPRSSVDFTNVGKEVDVHTAREGDLILFTGTVDTVRVVGHMGIVTENVDTLRFIHSTSGKANGVTISVLDNHYKKRFVKVIRVLSD